MGQTTYTKKHYTPKRKGDPAGHGWVRDVEGGSAANGRAECSAGMVELLDYIESLEIARGADRPSVFGHDRVIIDRIVKLVHVALRTKAESADPVDTRRGSTFRIRTETRHVIRVDVTMEGLDV